MYYIAPGEGANLNRRLVPYHVKCRRIQSGIEHVVDDVVVEESVLGGERT